MRRFADCMPLIEEVDSKKLYDTFAKIKFVDEKTDEPLVGLCFYEVDYILSKIIFSKKTKYNNFIKVILQLHCLGYSDTEITEGLNRIRVKKINKDAVKKIRQRALFKIKQEINTEIGIITLLYENFRGDFVPK